MKLIISTFLLTVVFAVAAMAQRDDTVTGGDLGRGLQLSGTQTAAAQLNSNVFEGNTFMFTANDDVQNYALSVSIDYVANPEEAQSYYAVGGSWTLSVFRDGNLVGTIYGDITGGGINEIMDENSVIVQRAVEAQFRTQGGTGEFSETIAQDEAAGTMSVVTEGPATSGSLFNVL
jgi:hypothetical protein